MSKTSLFYRLKYLQKRTHCSLVNIPSLVFLLTVCILTSSPCYGSDTGISTKSRILVVDSYHKGYPWSQETNNGFCAAMTDLGYFDNEKQVAVFNRDDQVTTTKAVIERLWLDSKRRNTEEQILKMSAVIYQKAKEFQPDLIFLGDDNAAKYIGRQFLDTRVPIVFWGLNNSPVKYGLVDRIDRPGHNATGVYQSGNYVDNLNLLKTLFPEAKTFALLSTGNSTGRSLYKGVERLAQEETLPLELVDKFMTNDYDLFKTKVLELQDRVDAIYLAHFSGFKDKKGNYVSIQDVIDWYCRNSRVPEIVTAKSYVERGLLLTAEDSGFNQGYTAVKIANDILYNHANPALYAPVTPPHGQLLVNRQRAVALGIDFNRIPSTVLIIDTIQGS